MSRNGKKEVEKKKNTDNKITDLTLWKYAFFFNQPKKKQFKF